MKLVLLAAGMTVVLTACAPTQAPMGASPPSVSTPAEIAACRALNGQADRRCTPGVLNSNVTQATIGTMICVKGWTATVRPPVSYTDTLKRRQMAQYGEVGSPLGFEEDHLVPLEVGGSPTDPKNLWPEPRTGPHPASEKDSMENAVKAAICAGRITLAQGQGQLLTKWSR